MISDAQFNPIEELLITLVFCIDYWPTTRNACDWNPDIYYAITDIVNLTLEPAVSLLKNKKPVFIEIWLLANDPVPLVEKIMLAIVGYRPPTF